MKTLAPSSTDRRIPRTRGMLQQALMSLILKKDYEAITITDICEAANVGRSTFYAHYTSKDDLKRSGFENLRRLLVERQREVLSGSGDAKQRRLGFSLPLLEHARDHMDLYRALIGGRGGAMALEIIRKMLSDLVRGELATTGGKAAAEEMPREFVVQFVVGAYMSVLTWWLDGGAKLPPGRIDAMFHNLATAGLAPPEPKPRR